MATHIQIGDIAPRVYCEADGTQKKFDYSFPIFKAADLTVYLYDTVQSAGFTITDTLEGAGGFVMFDVAPVAGTDVTLARRLPIERMTDFQESGEFRSKVLNDELDYQTAALQQLDDAHKRSVHISPFDPTIGEMYLPTKTVRAGRVMGFDDNGLPVASTETLAQIEGAATHAAAAASSADAAADSAAAADIPTHAALTTTHGVAGDIVGTSDTQTLTNKTFSDQVPVLSATAIETGFRMGNTAATNNYIGTQPSGHMHLGTSVGHSVEIKTSNVTRLTVDGISGDTVVTGSVTAAGLSTSANVKLSNNLGVRWNDSAATTYIAGVGGATGSDYLQLAVTGVPIIHCMQSGNVGIGTTAPNSYKLEIHAGGNGQYVTTNSNAIGQHIQATDAAYGNTLQYLSTSRAADAGFDFGRCYTSSGGDLVFKHSGNGNGTCDGAWTGGGADFGVALEWADANSLNEDRTGWSVMLENGKIRRALVGEIPFGVVSEISSYVDNAYPLRWRDKFLTDDLLRPVMETYTVTEWVVAVPAVLDADDNITEAARAIPYSYASDQIPATLTVPADATVKTHDDNGMLLERRTANPAYDPAAVYVPRMERPEWAAVAKLGPVPMLKGEATNPAWSKMFDISASTEMWFVE